MQKYKKLAVNLMTFFIGNMGSRVIQFIFIPMYTYWLSTYEYGIIDTIVITVSLLGPFVSLTIQDALLRFLLENKKAVRSYYTTSIVIWIAGSIVFCLSYFIFQFIEILRPYWLLFYLYMLFNTLYSIQTSMLRGLEKNKLYSGLGMLNTLLQVLAIVLFVAYLRLGVAGYLMAQIIVFFITILLSIILTKSWKLLSLQAFNKKDTMEMINYSIPLVPNAIMWWIINSSDKYMIVYFLSASANGIFAIASKIPTVINVLYQIFLMAWQISAVDEYQQNGNKEFYNRIYNWLVSGLFIFASMIFIVLKPTVHVLFESSYYESWKYIPILFISAIFSCLAGYYGTFYVTYRQTKGALKTSCVCAAMNLVLNFILLRIMGMLGVAIATLVSFFTLYVYRIKDTKLIVDIPSEMKIVLLNVIVLVTQTVIMFLTGGMENILLQVLMFTLALFVNKKIVIEVRSLIISVLRRRQNV